MGVARSAQLALLTLTLSSAAGFGGLTRGATAEPEPYVEKQAPAAFTAAAERCRDRLGHTLGAEWMSCVIDELLCARPHPPGPRPARRAAHRNPHRRHRLAPLSSPGCTRHSWTRRAAPVPRLAPAPTPQKNIIPLSLPFPPRSAAQASPVEGAPTLPFAVVPHTYDPLQPDPKYRMEPGYRAADELRFLLRDFSCDSEDGGSQ
eukprot:scaffold23861_cov110-Isochrysis_galbana.AAC.4